MSSVNARNIVELRQLLAEKFPGVKMSADPRERIANRWPTGVAQVDTLLEGGLPKGAITEIVSSGISSGSALFLTALLERARENGEWLALVDASDSFDPAALENDVLSRLLHGARLSLMIGLVAVVLAMTPGIALGLAAAFFPRIGTAILRLMDVMLALPSLLLAIAVVAVLGPGLINTMLAIALVAIPNYVRLVRASAMSELAKDYVIASRLAGAGTLRLMFNTVLPNCMAPVIVTATLGFSDAILTAAALGFLGLGAQPPTPEWGTMLASARDYIERANWVVTLPGVAILSTVLAINLMGDGLRDALDPRMKRLS